MFNNGGARTVHLKIENYKDNVNRTIVGAGKNSYMRFSTGAIIKNEQTGATILTVPQSSKSEIKIEL
jgi:hypothetical protein